MVKRLFIQISLWIVLLVLPTVVSSHPADDILTKYDYGGFLAGIFHPVLGWDHLLAMVCVGVLSAQIGGAAMWKVPMTFVVVMSLGGLAALFGIGQIPVEFGIALSVVLLGSVIALETRMSSRVAMLFVGVFAVFHGMAHGLEIPQMAEPVAYVAGFISGTSLIHLFGVGVGWLLTRRAILSQGLRGLGAAVAVFGLYLLWGL